MYEVTSIEARNKPAIALVNEIFLHDAVSAASQKGIPGVRIVPETVDAECIDEQIIEQRITPFMDDIIAALTRPLTDEEKYPKTKKESSTSKIVFKGNFKEVNQFLYRRGWGDGLPLVPPTEEEVAEMLTGTDLPPDHVVTKIIPRLGKATVEKIAINAVMAGALPTYMPLLIAGVEAITDPESKLIAWGFSTSSHVPLWIVNGPVRNDLNINSGGGVLSPGDIANSTIGRAMQLIIKNIGGIRKGVEEMGSLGNPGKYSMVVAENEEKSPWEPLHVSRGFEKDESAVSLAFSNIYWQMLPNGTDERAVLSAAVHDIGVVGGGESYLLLSPAAASFLASKGLKKQEAIDLIEKVTGPTGMPSKEQVQEKGSKSSPNPFGSISVQIIVAGGAQNAMGILKGFSKGRVTKKVNLPANWNKLVSKYKNLVPTYSKY